MVMTFSQFNACPSFFSNHYSFFLYNLKRNNNDVKKTYGKILYRHMQKQPNRKRSLSLLAGLNF